MLAKRLIRFTLILVIVAVCLAAPRGASAGSGCGPTYVVQKGDWLAKIANRCSVTLSALYAANPWTRSIRYIYPGQMLNIPGGPGPGPQPGPGPKPFPGYGNCGPKYSDYYGKYYVVCHGDTLLGIALYYGEHLSYMQWHNHIYNPDRIFAGQFIFP